MLFNGELDIDVYAPTRGELLTELRAQLAMLWQEFGLEDDSALSEPARQLKWKLRQLVSVPSNAPR